MMKEADAAAAYEALRVSADAVLIDCRTKAEWMLIGCPDLAQINKQTSLIEWQGLDGRPNADFTQQACDIAASDVPVFIICRSGARSASACQALIATGFSDVTNVSGGFEGPPDSNGHRAKIDGWKAKGLPWRQN